jgi:hypothetical protein
MILTCDYCGRTVRKGNADPCDKCRKKSESLWKRGYQLQRDGRITLREGWEPQSLTWQEWQAFFMLPVELLNKALKSNREEDQKDCYKAHDVEKSFVAKAREYLLAAIETEAGNRDIGLNSFDTPELRVNSIIADNDWTRGRLFRAIQQAKEILEPQVVKEAA